MTVLNLNDILEQIDVSIMQSIADTNKAGKIVGVTHSLRTNKHFQLICERAIIEIDKQTLEPIGIIHIFNI